MTGAETELVRRLRQAGCVFAEDEAAVLLDGANDPGQLERMTAQREAGLPLEQIVGWAEFDGLRIALEPGVFVPRRRSGLLVALASEHVQDGSIVLDLCCGTGALGAALLARHPAAEVYAADVDPAAVANARRNLHPLRVFEGDLYAALPHALRGGIDVLLVNAPYVPTEAISLMPPEARDHEHRVALDGGADGLDVQRRVVAEACGWLSRGGVLLVETGADQASTTAALMVAVGLTADTVSNPETGSTAVRGRRVVSAWSGRR